MRPYLTILLILSAAFTSAGAVLFQSSVTIPENSGGCVRVAVCAPESIRGFTVTDAGGGERLVGLVSHVGGRWELYINGTPGIYRLNYLDTPPRHWSSAPKSGLIHLYRPYDGSVINTHKEFSDHWKRNESSEKRGWSSQIFCGGNELGPTRPALHIYHGSLRFPEENDYTLHICSTDTSFLFIDGKCIASLPGRHDVNESRRGEYCGRLRLRPGWHSIDFCHANNRQDSYVIVAFSRLSDQQMTIIPREWYSTAVSVIAGPLKTLSGATVESLSWSHTGTLQLRSGQIREITFSDGTRRYFSDESPIHAGDYTILSPTDYFPQPLTDEQVRRFIDGLCRQLVTSHSSPALLRLFFEACQNEHYAAAALHFMDSVNAIRKKGLLPTMPTNEFATFYRRVVLPERLAHEQLKALKSDLGILSQYAAAESTLYAACMAFYIDRDDQRCAELLKKCDASQLTDESLRRCRGVLEADRALFSEGYDAALQKYSVIPSAYTRMSERQKMEFDGRVLMLRTAVTAAQLEDTRLLLAELRQLHPGIYLNSEVAWLQSQYLHQSHCPRQASYYAEVALRTHPLPPTRSAARLFLARDALKRGRSADGYLLLKQLLTEDSRSPEAVVAAKLIKNAGRPRP